MSFGGLRSSPESAAMWSPKKAGREAGEMILKIHKNTVEKVVQCDGYLRTRFAYRDSDDPPTEVRPGEIATKHTETRDLGIQEVVTKGWKAVTVIEPRGNRWWGAFNLPEEGPNRMFVCNDDGDTIDRLNWG